MAQTVQLKRSATENAAPTTSDLELGELAINTYDGKVYIKKSVSGTESIIQVGETASNQFTSYQHCKFSNSGGTLSAGDTSFSGSDDNSETLGYTAGQVFVALNGVILDPDDYVATNGTTVVLDTAVEASDVVEVISLGTSAGSALTGITKYEFTTDTTTNTVDGATTSSTSVEINATNSAILVGMIVTGTGISGTVSVSAISGTTVTLSSAQTLADGVTLTFARTDVFQGTDDNGKTFSYDVGEELVFVNGVLFDPRSGKDYTRTSTSAITFNSTLQDDDTVVIHVYGGSNPFNRFQFYPTGASTSVFEGNDADSVTLSYHPDYAEVYVNGILMEKGQWSGGGGKKITLVDPLTDPDSNGYTVDIIDYKIEAVKVRLFKDDAPFLGGDLMLNGYSIKTASGSGNNITMIPDSGQYVSIQDAPLHLDILAADPSGITDHASLYAKDASGSAELFVRDEAGNVTQISPHMDGEWTYYSENVITGKRFKVNMEKMIRKLQEITGETFIEIDE